MTSNNRTLRSSSPTRGFTLVELIVTMGLAAILFAVAIPSFRGMMAGNRLVTQTNDLVGALTVARSEAITRNSNMTFCRTAADADTVCDGGTVATAWGFWIVRNPAGDVIKKGAIPTYAGVMKITSTFSNNTVVFSSDGLARNGVGTGALLTDAELITICTSTVASQNRRVVIPGSGSRISTTKATGAC